MAIGSWYRILFFCGLYYVLMFMFFDSRIVVAGMEPAKTVKNPQANDGLCSKFAWEIQGFTRRNEKKLYSETFVLCGHKWRILVFPKGNGGNQLSVYLDVADSAVLPTGWSRQATFILTVINQFSRRRSVRKETLHLFNSAESDWGFTSFMPLAEILDPHRGFIVNDAIIIELEIQECLSNDSEQISRIEHEKVELLVPTVEIQSEREEQISKTEQESAKLLVPTVDIQNITEVHISETDHEPFEIIAPTIEIQSETNELIQPIESELAKDETLLVVASHGDSPCQQEVEQATIVSLEEEGLGIKVSDQPQILSEEVQDKVHDIKDELPVDRPHFAEEGNNQVLQPELVSLDNDQSTISAPKDLASQSEPQSECKTIDINGFLVLLPQVDIIRQVFEKHPDLASNCRLRNVELRSAFVAFLYAVMDMLCQSPEDISEEDLKWVEDGLIDLEYGGFQVDWLNKKVAEIKEKKEQASGSRLEDLAKQIEQVKAVMLNLEAQLEKEKAETVAAKSPLSFNHII